MNFSDIPQSGTCKQCGKVFKPKAPNAKYCTLGCRERADSEAKRKRELRRTEKRRANA